MPPDYMLTAVDNAFLGIARAREAFVPSFSPHETGTITTVSTGIATVIGSLLADLLYAVADPRVRYS